MFDLASFMYKRKLIGLPIEFHISFNFPWFTQQDVTCFYGSYITQQNIFIFSNGKIDGLQPTQFLHMEILSNKD